MNPVGFAAINTSCIRPIDQYLSVSELLSKRVEDGTYVGWGNDDDWVRTASRPPRFKGITELFNTRSPRDGGRGRAASCLAAPHKTP